VAKIQRIFDGVVFNSILLLALIEVKIPQWSGGTKWSRVMRNCNGKQEIAPKKEKKLESRIMEVYLIQNNRFLLRRKDNVEA
jgi:hypothetical protein